MDTPGENASGALLIIALIPLSSVAVASPNETTVRKSVASTTNEIGAIITGFVLSIGDSSTISSGISIESTITGFS